MLTLEIDYIIKVDKLCLELEAYISKIGVRVDLDGHPVFEVGAELNGTTS